MSCSRRPLRRPLARIGTNSRPRRLPVVAAAIVSLMVMACGKKGDPLPPLRYVPQAASNLTVRQLGNQLVFSVGYPKTATNGMALPGLEALEIFELSLPKPATGEAPAVDPRQFNPRAQLLEKVTDKPLTAATLGDRLEIHRPVADLREGLLLTYGVRFLDKSGERSAFSNLVTLGLAAPPVAPAGLAVEASAEGITVRWTPGAEGVGGYRVYRRFAEERYYTLPLATLGSGDKGLYLDRAVSLDRRYVYTVTAVSAQSAATESPLGAEREIEYRDRFPPAAPASLVALAEPGQARLSWEPGSLDSRSYHVFQRSSADRDYRRLTEKPIGESRFVASDLVAGQRYTFRVSALDELGNESSPCPEVEIEAQ